MEKPTGVIQKIIESLQQVNALDTYSPIEKDIILHNLRAAYMIFLNIPPEEQSTESRVEKLFAELPSVLTDGAECRKQNAESRMEEIENEEVEDEKIESEEVEDEEIESEEIESEEVESARIEDAEIEIEESNEEHSPSNFEGVPEGRGSLYTIHDEPETVVEEVTEEEIPEYVEPAEEEEIINEEFEEAELPSVLTDGEEMQNEENDDEVIRGLEEEIVEEEIIEEPELPSVLTDGEEMQNEESEEIVAEEETQKPTVLQDDILEFIPDAKPQSHLLFDEVAIPKSEVKSLNDLLEKKDDNSLGAKFQHSYIPDLTKAIGINEKFSFIRELFHNSGVDFSNAIQKLNECENIDDAFLLMEELKHQYLWDTTSSAYLSLCDLVRRRFI
jgi:hypothetical protein